MTLAKVWKRIVDWHIANGSIDKFQLNTGATSEAISAFERAIAAPLPDDFRDSLLLHNGGNEECWLICYGEFLSLDGMLRIWSNYGDWQTRQLPVGFEDLPSFHWDAKHIPITDNSGTHLVLDLASLPGRGYGQILLSDEHEAFEVVAPSWKGFLDQLADDLEAGKHK